MELYVGIDVSLQDSSVCIVDRDGKVVRERKVMSDPDALAQALRDDGCASARIGLEAGALSGWLHDGLKEKGFDVVLLETRHVAAAISAMAVKTDRYDARGIAQMLRLGWFKPVHAKSAGAQEIRALLSARKLLTRKRADIDIGMRGILRAYGLKVGRVGRGRFDERLRELVAGNAMLEKAIGAMLEARNAMVRQLVELHRTVLRLTRESEVCKRLMTVPGVGPVASLTFVAAVDDPQRFRSSRSLGAHFGLTPRKYQSGEVDLTGHITRAGDASVRTVLYEAANALITLSVKPSGLKSWAMRLVKRRGAKRAKVAVARRLAVLLHRMWVDGTDFDFGVGRMTLAA